MDTIQSFLTQDHKDCDDLFIETENAVSVGNWDRAYSCFALFQNAMEHHLLMEEEVLFPALEEKMGTASGPTAVMRNEHRQIRMLLKRLSEALSAKDKNSYLGHSETLNIMVQQHNLKEESVLYQMADRMLKASAEELMEAMHQLSSIA